jgi:[ribosomal protein S5]-alanine N-acetyltransferase
LAVTTENKNPAVPTALRLIPIVRDGQVELSGVRLPEVAMSVVASTVALYARRGYVAPWIGYLAIEGGVCVGSCGFASPPVDGVAEIAYFTFPEREGRGVATRMAQRLISLAQECDPSMKLIAHTLTDENASTCILKKLGFVFMGTVNHPEDGTIWRWTYERKTRRA